MNDEKRTIEKTGGHFPDVDILTTYITFVNGVGSVGELHRPTAVRAGEKTMLGFRYGDGVILIPPDLAGFAPLFYRPKF